MRVNTEKMKSKQMLAIEKFVENPFAQQKQIAAEIGVGENTISRWLKDEEFIAKLNQRMNEEWEFAINKAKKKVVQLLEDDNPTIAFNASKLILDKIMPDRVESGLVVRIEIEED